MPKTTTPTAPPPPAKLPKFSPRMTAVALQAYGPHLDENPWANSDVVPPEGAPTTWRETLMQGLLKIRDKNGRLRKLVLNRAQQDLEHASTKRNIVLKARQLGVTTYVAARFFINCITRQGTLSVQVAHDQRSAEEIFRIVHRFLDNLLEPLRKGALVTSRANVRQIVFPMLDSEYRVETAADDSVQQAWLGEYNIVSDFLPVEDVLPGNAAQVSVSSLGADFNAIVREVELQVVSLADDRSQYDIKFANDACESLALKFEVVALPESAGTVYDLGTPSSSPLIDSLSAARIYDTGTPSSSLYIDPLTAAQVTNVIATEISMDAGVAPPAGGGIEVRRSDGGWGPGDSDNLAGRFTTQQFTVPRLERVQGYYLRQYDGSSPAKYSRYSVLLHVDYPL